jgi:uncharacterized protein
MFKSSKINHNPTKTTNTGSQLGVEHVFPLFLIKNHLFDLHYYFIKEYLNIWYRLNKKVYKGHNKNATVIEGFPGFGLVGTITTGFLIDHLKCERIGQFYFEQQPATIAIHSNKVVDPLGIYYNKKYNLIIIHAIASSMGVEWKAADVILEMCKELKCQQIISIEGVGGPPGSASQVFYHTTDDKESKKLTKIGIKNLGEGIIVGVTAALLLKSKLPITCLFAQTPSKLPDSKAAAEVINTLDKLLGLKVDSSPLLEQAKNYEGKLKKILEKGIKAKEGATKKQMSYFG